VNEPRDRTGEWLVANGFPTVGQATPEADPAGWTSPLVVKLPFGSAGIGVDIVRDADELAVAVRRPELGEMVVQTLAGGREHTIVVGMLEERDAIPADVAAALQNDLLIHWKGVDWNTPPLYAATDIVVLPTYRESFPNVPLEAAAMELPVVATNVVGCTDAIEDGVTGLLVPPRDVAALVAALRRYIEEAMLRRRHGRAARKRVVRMFRQEQIWEALHAECQRLMRGKA
jgi:glycosyltransferase involved in cell wall biosynthesis